MQRGDRSAPSVWQDLHEKRNLVQCETALYADRSLQIHVRALVVFDVIFWPLDLHELSEVRIPARERNETVVTCEFVTAREREWRWRVLCIGYQ